MSLYFRHCADTGVNEYLFIYLVFLHLYNFSVSAPVRNISSCITLCNFNYIYLFFGIILDINLDRSNTLHINLVRSNTLYINLVRSNTL